MGSPIAADGAAGSAAGSSAAGMGAGAGANTMAGRGAAAASRPQATFAPTFSAVFKEILANNNAGNCGFGACHGSAAGAENGNLQLLRNDPAAAYQALVSVTSVSASCMGMTLVAPGDPRSSLLVLKLRATPPCGAQMPIPPVAQPLSEAQIQQIETWIMNGALND
jgi:hypothetical protein